MSVTISEGTKLSLKDQVVRFLLSRIFQHHEGYKPGSYISEKVVSDDFERERGVSVSRVPVREAFVELELAGFLKVIPQRGTQIINLDKDDVDKLLESRLYLETRIAKELIRKPHVSVEPARKLNEELKKRLTQKNPTENDWLEFVELDRQFHVNLGYLSGRTELAEALDRVRKQIYLAAPLPKDYSPRMKEIVVEHDEILNAIRPQPRVSGNEMTALEAVRVHLDKAGEMHGFSKLLNSKSGLFNSHTKAKPQVVIHSYTVRSFIELEVAKDLTWGDSGLLTEPLRYIGIMQDIRNSVVGKPTKEQRLEFTFNDMLFHCSLVSASRHSYLLEALRRIWNQDFDYAATVPSETHDVHLDAVIAEHQDITLHISIVQRARRKAQKAAKEAGYEPDSTAWCHEIDKDPTVIKEMKKLEECILLHISEAFNRWKALHPDSFTDMVVKESQKKLLEVVYAPTSKIGMGKSDKKSKVNSALVHKRPNSGLI